MSSDFNFNSTDLTGGGGARNLGSQFGVNVDRNRRDPDERTGTRETLSRWYRACILDLAEYPSSRVRDDFSSATLAKWHDGPKRLLDLF